MAGSFEIPLLLCPFMLDVAGFLASSCLLPSCSGRCAVAFRSRYWKLAVAERLKFPFLMNVPLIEEMLLHGSSFIGYSSVVVSVNPFKSGEEVSIG